MVLDKDKFLKVPGVRLSEGRLTELVKSENVIGLILRVNFYGCEQFVEAQKSFADYLDDIAKRGFGHLSLKEEAPTAYQLGDLEIIKVKNRDLNGAEVEDWGLYPGPRFNQARAVGLISRPRKFLRRIFAGCDYLPINA